MVTSVFAQDMAPPSMPVPPAPTVVSPDSVPSPNPTFAPDPGTTKTTTTTTTETTNKYGTPTENSPTVTGEDNPDQESAPSDDLVYLNATDADITDIIKQISKATGTNFLIDDKVKGKITIVSEKPMTKDMAYQAFLSALQVMGFTTVATPSGLIKIVQTKEAIDKPLELYKEDSPNTDRFITRIIQVKNISANDISTVIKNLVSKDGNLFAYPSTNTLILTDAGSNIDRILKIIHELDQEGPQQVIEIIPIQNADASDISDKITQLFAEDASKSGGRSAAKGKSSSELEELPSVSKVITDDRTNSIIVLGTKRAILKVRALVAQLDAPMTGTQGELHVYYLKYANAKELAEVLSALTSGTSSKSSKSGSTTQAAGSVELQGGVKVTADEATNSLVITASPKDYDTLMMKVVSQLDIPRRQVYLEAIVMELSVGKTRQTGLSGNLGNIFNVLGGSLAGFGALLPIAQTDLATIAGAAGGFGGGVVSDQTISFTTAAGTTTVPAISAIIHALQSDTDSNILSTPSILTLDNQEAKIQVGNEVPTPSGTTVATGATTFNVTREDTGVILKITPQISESDNVRLKLSQEITDVVGTDTTLGPTLTKRSVDTVVVAHDKQTIVIGGLIGDTTKATTNKVPGLGDIPVVGNLFKNKKIEKDRTNIIVFITPYIIRNRDDYLAILKRKIDERNLFIEHNYAPAQRKVIRESIRNHAASLLEYKGDVTDAGTGSVDATPTSSTIPPSSTSTPSTDSSSTTTVKTDHQKVKYQSR